MNGVKITRIQDVQTYLQPRTKPKLIETLANKLSHNKGTAESSIDKFTNNNNSERKTAEEPQEYYGLVQKYHGDAKKSVTKYGARSKWEEGKS